MKKIIANLLLILTIVNVGCNDNFYEDFEEGDLWRLPLIKPYDIKNVVNATPQDDLNDNWHLVFNNLKEGGFKRGVNITKINVSRGIIYGYGTKYPCQPFLINTNTKEERIFQNETEWRQALITLKLNPDSVYNVWELFQNFKDQGTLNWTPTK